MALTIACHVESAAGSGAASVVATCQWMEESRSIRYRRWSRIVGIIAVCQGIVEPRGIRRRRWGRVVAVIAVCQEMMELHGIHRREWSRIVVVAVSRQGVQIHRLKFGSGRSW